MTKSFGWHIAGTVAVIVALGACGFSGGSPRRNEDAITGEVVMRKYGLCGKEISDVSLMVEALQHKDMETLTGLIVRGKVLELNEGIRVNAAGSVIDGLASIRIRSGANAGADCYLPTTMLQ